MDFKQAELPAGLKSLDGQSALDYSLAAAFLAVRFMGATDQVLAGVLPANAQAKEVAIQVGVLKTTAFSGGYYDVTFKKAFPKCLMVFIPWISGKVDLELTTADLSGVRVRRSDGINAACVLSWVAIGC